MRIKEATLSIHEAGSVWEYIRELEEYVEVNEGEEDLKNIKKSFNSGGKLNRGINKLNVYREVF